MEGFFCGCGVRSVGLLFSTVVSDLQLPRNSLVLPHVLRLLHVEVFVYSFVSGRYVFPPREYGKSDGVTLRTLSFPSAHDRKSSSFRLAGMCGMVRHCLPNDTKWRGECRATNWFFCLRFLIVHVCCRFIRCQLVAENRLFRVSLRAVSFR